MRNPGGALLICDDGREYAKDTFTCAHCGRIVILEARQAAADAGGWCRPCAAPICPSCVGKDCVPQEKWIEALERRMAIEEARAEARRSYGF